MAIVLADLAGLGLGVGQISDALDELGLPPNAGGGYRMLGGAGTAFGRAFTLRQEPAQVGQPSVTRQGEAALTLAQPGDILIIDAGGLTDIATWGEGHTLRAMTNGLAGVVLHGATRDAAALATRSLPVLCRGTSPLRSKGRLHTACVQEVVTIGGVRIAPGDLVAIGPDGIAAVAARDEEAVIAKALEILAVETARDRDLEARAGLRAG